MILPCITDTYKNVEIDHFVFIWCLTIKVMHHSDYYIDTGLKKWLNLICGIVILLLSSTAAYIENC